jgi:hypothetical protein
MAENDACQRCGAPMTWAVTPTGSKLPLDPEPRSDGNVIYEGGLARFISGEMRRTYTGDRYVSHFATCPNADQFRHYKRKSEGEDMAGSKKVGALWLPKEGSKAKLTGTIELGGLKAKVAMFENDKWEKGSRLPKYNLVMFEEPTPVASGGGQRGGGQGQRSASSAPRSSQPAPATPAPPYDDEVI